MERMKLCPHFLQTVRPFFTSVPQAGHARRPERVTSQTTPRMTSIRAQRKMMTPTPTVAPIPVPTSQLSSSVPVSPSQFSAAAPKTLITQTRNSTLMMTMIHVNVRQTWQKSHDFLPFPDFPVLRKASATEGARPLHSPHAEVEPRAS